jgi:hypothetical protein
MAELVLAAAVHCTALPADLLAQAYDDQLADPDGWDLQLAAIRGALIVAAATLVDQLLDDTAALAGGGDVSDTTQLVNLPPQFGPHYTAGFARRFLLVPRPDRPADRRAVDSAELCGPGPRHAAAAGPRRRHR